MGNVLDTFGGCRPANVHGFTFVLYNTYDKASFCRLSVRVAGTSSKELQDHQITSTSLAAVLHRAWGY